jgi:hypothetical protein
LGKEGARLKKGERPVKRSLDGKALRPHFRLGSGIMVNFIKIMTLVK